MTIQRWIAAATGLAVVLTLSACTSSRLVAGSEVRIAVTAPLTSLNPASQAGRTSSTAAEVAELTGTGFGFRDASGELVLDESLLGAAQAGGGGAEGDADGPEPFTPTGHVDAGLLMRM